MTGQQHKLPVTLKEVHKQNIQDIKNGTSHIPNGVHFDIENEDVIFINSDFYQVVLHN
jgi:hypothetical protein